MKKKDFMKKLLYFMKDYKKESVLAPLFKMLEAFFELFVPLLLRQSLTMVLFQKILGIS